MIVMISIAHEAVFNGWSWSSSSKYFEIPRHLRRGKILETKNF